VYVCIVCVCVCVCVCELETLNYHKIAPSLSRGAHTRVRWSQLPLTRAQPIVIAAQHSQRCLRCNTLSKCGENGTGSITERRGGGRLHHRALRGRSQSGIMRSSSSSSSYILTLDRVFDCHARRPTPEFGPGDSWLIDCDRSG
jgi:hypothetical protein